MSTASFNELPTDTTSIIIYLLIGIWFVFYVVQSLMAYGTAYRCTKNGNDNGVGLFIYLIGFTFASLIPGLGLHYYIKNLPPKIIIKQQVQPQVIRVIDPSQINARTQVQQAQSNEAYQQQMDRQAYAAMQQRQAQQQYSTQQSQSDNINNK